MSSNNFFRSDLFRLHNIVQASMLVYPKELIIATLRDFFSKDSYYHYAKDVWGFAATTDHTDLPLGADVPTLFNKDGANQEGLSTRLFIGENYRYDGIYYPAILVKTGAGRSVPISFNRNQNTVQYEDIVFIDGYGNQTLVSKPKSLITAGAWEGSLNIDVETRSLRSRDDLVELITMCFTDITFDTLSDIGLIIKPISWSAPTETDDRNDKLFRQTLTLDVRTEWRREIPVNTIIDAILFSMDFGRISNPNAPIAQNLNITTRLDFVNTLPGS